MSIDMEATEDEKTIIRPYFDIITLCGQMVQSWGFFSSLLSAKMIPNIQDFLNIKNYYNEYLTPALFLPLSHPGVCC